MADNGEIVPLPERQPVATLDDRPLVAPRSGSDILKEGLLVLPHMVVLLTRLLRDPHVPLRRKLVAGVAAAYVVSPIDLLPDAIPVLGRMDDLVVVALAIDHLVKGVPEEIVHGHWPGSLDALELTSAIVEWIAELVPTPLRQIVGH